MGALLVEEQKPEDTGSGRGVPVHRSRGSIKSRKSEYQQVVEFTLGNEFYGVDLLDTRKVITTPQVTPLPNTPVFVNGMIDLRGVITTIIDLKAMMHITREATGKKQSRVIVLDKMVSVKMIGILVDDVTSVLTYSQDEIDRDAQSSQEGHGEIIGVIRKHKKDTSGKEKSSLIIWLEIASMIRRVEKDL